MLTEILSLILRLLLPSSTDLRLETITTDDLSRCLTLEVTSTQALPACPRCQTPTSRFHSSYIRTLADLPWADVAVRLHLTVRKCFCPNDDCPRRIFAERVPAIATPWSRRTTRLATAQQRIGLALGGAAGSRLAHALSMSAGIDLLLVLVRRAPVAPRPQPRAIGVDEWAHRKGQTYGTIIVDLETGDPLDVLPERSAASLSQWLQEHPGVEVIGRDRAGVYAEGGRDGAPDALQVADRWHLLKNCSEMLLRVLQLHQVAIEQALTAPPVPEPASQALLPADPAGRAPGGETSPETSTSAPARARTEQMRQQRQAVRQARYETIQRLHQQGWTQRAIASQLGLATKTVRKYLHAASCPVSQRRPPRPKLLTPYTPYLLKRLEEGCYNAAQLFRELQAQGFRGKHSIVRDFVTQLRKAQGLPQRARSGLTIAGSSDARGRIPTLRTLAWRILARPGKLEEHEQAQVETVRHVHEEVDLAVALAQEFAAMVRERSGSQLDGWLERASASGIPALRNFAASLRQDYAAVQAAVSLPWSNGPTEGNINRLKMLKRQMYGRAKVDLLKQRVLAA
ncbi:MAG: ISL3 family transposase [Chloroflexota bacterium]|nr:ISL3 family transposase [Chloroflexota bacterium]